MTEKVKHPAASRGATCSAVVALPTQVESLRNPAKPETPFFPVASHRASWRRRVKIGVIGCGKLAVAAHIRSFVEYLKDEVEVVAVADLDRERAGEAQKAAGARFAFTDYRELLARPEIEAVTVATHTAAHMQPTVDALRAGKHVLVEKPMALNSAECGAMVKAAERSGKLLMVEQALRFNALFETFKDIIDSGAIGEIFMFHCLCGHGGPALWNPDAKWFYDKSQGGGVMMDMGIHEADLMRWLIGQPVVQTAGMVAGFSDSRATADENGVAIFRFKNGALATLATSWSLKRSGRTVAVYGSKGHLALDTTAEKKVSLFREGGAVAYPEIRKVSRYGHGRAYAHFINCILGKEKCICTGEDAMQSVRVIECVYKSSETGKLIGID